MVAAAGIAQVCCSRANSGGVLMNSTKVTNLQGVVSDIGYTSFLEQNLYRELLPITG